MSINWNRVVKGIGQGKHPVIAFHEEEERQRQIRREENRKILEQNKRVMKEERVMEEEGENDELTL